MPSNIISDGGTADFVWSYTLQTFPFLSTIFTDQAVSLFPLFESGTGIFKSNFIEESGLSVPGEKYFVPERMMFVAGFSAE